ncbi:MAG: hypothetical protein Q4B77_00500 [Coriobacteriaceae bacterium]|nr:hypothetical protein [Coriobacteriaceae bacterium]
MGLFAKKDPQKLFEGTDFTVTRVLLDPPRMAPLPAVYLDEPAQRWAVKMPAAAPAIFAFSDIVECAVVESGDAETTEDIDRREFAQAIISSPARATRVNAARRGYCLGMGVAIGVKTEQGVSVLQIPLANQELKKTSTLYKRTREGAEEICNEFLAMRDQAFNQG